ncbi:MAG TPA: GEVED domain-containing protein [Chitinophagales bacterium]|nr:GEVED domain-containing protein [Chitinophagales bacterium]
MLIQLSTIFWFKQVKKALWLIAFSLLTQFATGQVVTYPTQNDNDSSSRKPLGCFYGYERTALLYTAGELGQGGSITKVAFFLNSKNNPAAATPVVIRMKTFTNSSLTSTTYANASSGSTQVFSGIITDDMLSPGNWVTITLGTAFNYNANNLLILVETNVGEFGDENFDAKQFRHSKPLSGTPRCEFWEDDLIPPGDYGVLSAMRPNIRLTFEANCAGTPTPGNTLSTATAVCPNEPFTLTLQNTPTTPGLTYVWQSSLTGNNPWNPIPGATASTLTTSQATAKYYRCIVTCNAGGATGTSTPIQVTMSPYYHCYCASYAADISDSKINSVTLADISTSSSPANCESYTDYTAVPGNVTAGQELTLKIENGSCSANFYDSYIGVYIDFSLDGVFDPATELVYGYGPITTLNGIPDYTFILPPAAITGVAGMRVILEEGDSVPKPCGEYTYGETEDYLLNITGATNCSGTPAPGATLSTEASVCANEQFTLSISNYQSNTGISYQWQVSTNGIDYNNLNGATSATRIQTQTSEKWYRCKVTCDNSGLFAFSDPIQISMNPFYACYCASYALNAEDTKIDTVKIGNLVAGSSPNSCESYTDNTALTLYVAKSDPVTIHIDNGDCSDQPQFYPVSVAVYIDFDTSKTYEASELVYSFSDTTALHSIPDGVFNIPASAKLATTGMRVILWEGETVPPACGTYGYGETEDYAISIVDQPPCNENPTPGVASTPIQSFCPEQVPATITLTLTDNSTGLGQTYQWQSSPDNTSYTDIPGETGTTATVTVTETTWYRCKVTCTGNDAFSQEVKVEVKATPAGNTKGDPIVIPNLPYTDIGNNFSANCWTSNYDTITQQPAPDVYYQLTLDDTTGMLKISTCETTSGFNTYLHLIKEDGTHLSSNDNNGLLCTGNTASIKYYIDSVPITLFIVVEGHASDEGVYKLDVDFVPDTATAIAQLPATLENDFSIYPNPGDGNVNVRVYLAHGQTKTAALILYNTVGQVIQTEQVSIVQGNYSGMFHLNAGLPDGVYNLQLNDGQILLSKPVVIQR